MRIEVVTDDGRRSTYIERGAAEAALIVHESLRNRMTGEFIDAHDGAYELRDALIEVGEAIEQVYSEEFGEDPESLTEVGMDAWDFDYVVWCADQLYDEWAVDPNRRRRRLLTGEAARQVLARGLRELREECGA